MNTVSRSRGIVLILGAMLALTPAAFGDDDTPAQVGVAVDHPNEAQTEQAGDETKNTGVRWDPEKAPKPLARPAKHIDPAMVPYVITVTDKGQPDDQPQDPALSDAPFHYEPSEPSPSSLSLQNALGFFVNGMKLLFFALWLFRIAAFFWARRT